MRTSAAPISLPRRWELKPWKQQSHISKMLRLWQPLLLVNRMTEPSTAPFPYGWPAWYMRAARLDLAQGSSVLKHTNLYIHGYLLFTCVSDLWTQDNCSLCLGKLTLGVLLLTLTSADLVWLNRQDLKTSLKLLCKAYQVTMNQKKRKIKLHRAVHNRKY